MDFLQIELYHNQTNSLIDEFKKENNGINVLNFLSINFNKNNFIILFEREEEDVFYKVFKKDMFFNCIHSEKIDILKRVKAKNKYFLMKYFLINEFSNKHTVLSLVKDNLNIFQTVFQNRENKYNKIILYIEKHEKEILYIQKNEVIFFIQDGSDTIYERYFLENYEDYKDIFVELKTKEKVNIKQDLLLSKIINEIQF